MKGGAGQGGRRYASRGDSWTHEVWLDKEGGEADRYWESGGSPKNGSFDEVEELQQSEFISKWAGRIGGSETEASKVLPCWVMTKKQVTEVAGGMEA